MVWSIFNFVGIIAFAVSGAFVAMKEDYDIVGHYVLGFTTAFGGGVFRNLIIGIPIEQIWTQDYLFITAFITITIIFITPNEWLTYWNKWGIIFDSIGLAVFSIQGALYALDNGASFTGIIVAATLTGSGGGMIRDIFSGRKPLIFREEIYALWASLGGIIVGLELVDNPIKLTILFILILSLRILSVIYKWRLPRHSYPHD